MSDYTDDLQRMDATVSELRVQVSQIAAILAQMRRDVRAIPARLDAIEGAMDVPQTVDAAGAARLIGKRRDWVYRNLAQYVEPVPGTRTWSRAAVLAWINQQAQR